MGDARSSASGLYEGLRILQRLRSCCPRQDGVSNWVAVKELNLSYYIGETLLFLLYIYIYPLW